MVEARTVILFPPETDQERFDGVSIALHWLTVLLVAGQFTSALVREDLHGPIVGLLLVFHRSAGVALWAVAALRLTWRHKFAYLPPFPANMPRLQQCAAKLNEYGLYGLLLLQPLTGLAATLTRGKAFTLFLWDVPGLMAPDKPLAHVLAEIHEAGAWAMAALIGLHAAAGLFHGLVLRDRVLQRMMPSQN